MSHVFYLQPDMANCTDVDEADLQAAEQFEAEQFEAMDEAEEVDRQDAERRADLLDVQTEVDSWSLSNATLLPSLSDCLGFGHDRWGRDDCFVFKIGMKEFAVSPSRSTFLNAMADRYMDDLTLPCMYEIVQGDWPKFYLDIEESFDTELTSRELQDLLQLVVEHIKQGLRELTSATGLNLVNPEAKICTNHRFKRDKFYLSAHVVFPCVLFETHTRGMKDFVKNIKTMASDKIRSLFDLNVYGKNQAFRCVFSPKTKNAPSFIPWDIVANKPIESAKRCGVRHLMETFLVSHSNAGNGAITMITDKAVGVYMKSDATKTYGVVSRKRPKLIKCANNPPPPKVAPVSVAPTKVHIETIDESIVRLMVPNLKKERWDDYTTWVMIGFAIASVFKGNLTAGYELFEFHSKQSKKYDAASCRRAFQSGNLQMNVSIFFKWIEEDVSPACFSTLKSKISDLRSAASAADMARRVASSSSIDLSIIETMAAAHDPDDPSSSKAAVIQTIVEYLNRFFVFIASSATGAYIDDGQDGKMIMRPKKGMVDAYEHFNIRFPGAKKEVSVINLWAKHRNRRVAAELLFEPWVKLPDVRPSVYNLFKGVAIPVEAAVQGDVEPILDHLLNVWADGDQVLFEYIINWMSHLVQHLGVKMGTVLVVKGEQGAGKGIIINRFLRAIIGDEHFMQIFNMDHMTGEFQSRNIRTNLLSFMDESNFAGNRKEASQFKGLITEKVRRFNEKNMPALFVKNRSNYLVASNDENMVFVEPRDRRFVPFECSNKYSGAQTGGTAAYFKKLAAIDPSHFAHYLYNRDISQFNPQKTPKTAYHRYQTKINLNSTGLFVNRILESGDIELVDPETRTSSYIPLSDDGQTDIFKCELFRAYSAMKFGNYKAHVTNERFFRAFYGFLALDPSQCVKFKKMPYSGRKRFIQLPELSELRRRFAERMGDSNWFVDGDVEEAEKVEIGYGGYNKGD